MNEKIKNHFKEEFSKERKISKFFNSDFNFFLIENWSNLFKKEIMRLLLDKKIIKNNLNFNLENLHNFLSQNDINYNIKDGVSKIGSLFYETDKNFIILYNKFLKFLYKEFFKFNFYFQKNPTIRFHFPFAEKEGANHYPRYHSDVQYGHSPREINLWFKLTNNSKSGLRIINLEESKKWYSKYNFDFDKFIEIASSQNLNFNNYGKKISKELKIDSKTLFAFDSRCIHTGEAREDDLTTRISIDIRVIPVEEYEWKVIDHVPIYRGKGRMHAEFKPGGKHGYNEFSIKEI